MCRRSTGGFEGRGSILPGRWPVVGSFRAKVSGMGWMFFGGIVYRGTDTSLVVGEEQEVPGRLLNCVVKKITFVSGSNVLLRM